MAINVGSYTRLSGSHALRLRETTAAVLALAGSLAIYVALRAALIGIAESSAPECLALDSVAMLAAGLMAGVRHADIPTLLRPLLRGIGAVVLAQVICDAATLLYGPADIVAGWNGWFFGLGSVIAIVAGFLALYRPSFVLPLFIHYVAFRHQINAVTGIDVSETDYLSMMDIGVFVAVGGLLAVGFTRRPLAERLQNLGIEPDRLKYAACSLVWAWAVGAHLGNYLISGWTKIRVGGSDPLFWLFHNPTQTAILIGLERGDNPFAAWPGLVQFSWDGIVWAGVGLNLFVLGIQIFCPIGLANRRLLMLFTVLFDLFHIAVYFTLGAFFFFWIAVNVLIYASARRIDDREFTPAMKLTALASVVLAHFVFYTNHLGWLDGAKLASPSVVAETRDGREVAVPAVYFGLLSYSIGQTATYIPDDHFPMRLGGNTYSQAEWHDAQSCGPEIRHHQDTGVGASAITRMVRETDAAMRLHPDVKNLNLYYFYPNHMPANPLMFTDFNRLKIDDIVGYRYRVESVCLGLHDGVLARDVRKRTDMPIDVEH
ncbi:MAG: hypothetical protein ACREFC_00155 [Stellaceae bacterium]